MVTLRSVFIVCQDVERSLEFYSLLGFILKERKSRSVVLDAGGKVELHLHQQLTDKEREQFCVSWSPGSSALVQSYESDGIDELASQLADNVLSGPVETPWGTRILILADPDGHRLELRERSPETLVA